MSKKKAKAGKEVQTPVEIVKSLANGDVRITYSRGCTITKNYQAEKIDIGISLDVPPSELDKAKDALYNFINGEVTYLVERITTKAGAPSEAGITMEELPLDPFGTHYNVPNPIPPADSSVPTPINSSITETLDDLDKEFDAFISGTNGTPIEEDIPDEF